jgi:ADP-ribose pyrophosphatase
MFQTISFRKKHSSKEHGESVHALTHTVHMAQHPQYPKRCEVKSTDWAVPEPSYHPAEFTHPSVLANDRSVKKGGWADPQEWSPSLSDEVKQRACHSLEKAGKVPFGTDGKPRNPVGRTGLVGRGLLGKWGPNQAADPLVTRFEPVTGALQMVAVQRADTKAWAIPGGMVDDGELVSATLRREFTEEAAGSGDAGAAGVDVKDRVDELFSKGDLVFTGCAFARCARALTGCWNRGRRRGRPAKHGPCVDGDYLHALPHQRPRLGPGARAQRWRRWVLAGWLLTAAC